MKPVTKERIIAAHKKIDAYREHLTGADQEILHTFACYGLNKVVKESAGLDTTSDGQKATLEMHLNGITPQKKGMIVSRLMKNINRVHKKGDKVKAIQLAHNISGLKRVCSCLQYSKGMYPCIERWEQEDDLWLTDDDLLLLKREVLKIAVFWVNYTTGNDLKVFQHIDGDWVPSAYQNVILESKTFDWATFSESLNYQKPNHDKPVRLLGSEKTYGYQIDTSPYPKEGFRKNHEVHLFLGDGKHLDDPENSAWFCATNKKRPSN